MPKPGEIIWGNIFTKKDSGEMGLLKFLKSISFFENLTPRQLKEVIKILHTRKYSQGEYLFEQGQPGAALFLIKSGEISIEAVNQDNTPVQLAILTSGTFVGELALLDQSPRSASARANKKSQTYALFRSDLNKLMHTHPSIACQIYRSLSMIIGERLKATNHLITNRKTEAA